MAARLTFPTAGRYDTRFLLEGAVPVAGFELDFLPVGPAPWPLFRDMVTDLSYDIGEQALSHYLIARDQGVPITAIPVFPSRFFPQFGITVNVGSGITTPADLAGKRVGVLSFGYNPAAWLRGILERYHGLDPQSVIWVEDADDPFFGPLRYPRPARFRIERMAGLAEGLFDGPRIRPLAALEDGRLDAFIAPGGGAPCTDRSRPLFPDRATLVRDYVGAGGAFPINTVITLRQSTVRRHPDLAGALCRAFVEARRRYHAEITAGREPDHMGVATADLRASGLFPDAYGIGPNRAAIETLIGYCHAQGVITRAPAPETLFEAV
ncbi:MAG: ABC transporter substrate-binding protein [Immundisolibacter sp.]|uniref:ABC transporter substrate-binding protein n=1 Tax=Immundisolibacter sp. TaxID=1934948 RepID=UPI003EE0F28C